MHSPECERLRLLGMGCERGHPAKKGGPPYRIQTRSENGFIKQRTDVTGRSHGGIPTPHTHIHAPHDGRVYPGDEIGMRPVLPIEIPQ